MRLNKTIFLGVISVFLFSGCISLTKELPSYKTYSLNLTNVDSNKSSLNKSIYILEPKAMGSLNSRAITYTKENQRASYALNKWSDKPTKMLQQLIAKGLTLKDSFKYVTTSNIRVKSDYRLSTELVDFNHNFVNNESFAMLSIRVFLINNDNEKVYFKNFVYNEKVSTNNAQGFVNTINNISNNFLEDLNTFILKSI